MSVGRTGLDQVGARGVYSKCRGYFHEAARAAPFSPTLRLLDGSSAAAVLRPLPEHTIALEPGAIAEGGFVRRGGRTMDAGKRVLTGGGSSKARVGS